MANSCFGGGPKVAQERPQARRGGLLSRPQASARDCWVGRSASNSRSVDQADVHVKHFRLPAVSRLGRRSGTARAPLSGAAPPERGLSRAQPPLCDTTVARGGSHILAEPSSAGTAHEVAELTSSPSSEPEARNVARIRALSDDVRATPDAPEQHREAQKGSLHTRR